MTCLYQVLLPHLGINHHFPVTLRHALPGHHGLGLPNPYWEQGINGLCLFLEQANTSSSEATLIQASLEFLQLELGTHANVFSLPCDTWKFLATDCWLKTIWQFVDFAQLQLTSLTLVIPPPP